MTDSTEQTETPDSRFVTITGEAVAIVPASLLAETIESSRQMETHARRDALAQGFTAWLEQEDATERDRESPRWWRGYIAGLEELQQSALMRESGEFPTTIVERRP